MTLMGRAVEYLPFIIHAMADAGRKGVGRERAPYELERVTAANGDELWRAGSNLAPRAAAMPSMRLAGERKVTVELVSPLRLVRNGAPIPPDEVDGPTLALAAVRRIALLRDGFAPTLPAIDLNELRAKSRSVSIVERELGWSDRRRYSTRQNRQMTMGGMTGKLILDVSDAAEFLPFLETCEQVHVGKGTTFGMGAISLTAA